MGEKNSTKTRVVPFMRELNNEIKKIKMFLETFPGIKPQELDFEDITDIAFGEEEKGLQANYELLIWLVQNPGWLDKSRLHPSNMSEPSYLKRKQLFDGDTDTIKEALDLLIEAKDKKKLTNQKWYAFEGSSYPDIYIETDNAIFIGEAKRTEPKLTTKTTWLHHRDQLIRHFDAAQLKDKQVKVFYIFEKTNFYKNNTKIQLEKYNEDAYILQSAPHRDYSFATEFRNAFAGYVFWENLSKQFSIDFE